MFYIFCDVDTKDAFWVSDDDCVPIPYTTEAEAVTAAKEYCCEAFVVRAVARITQRTTHKVEKIK